MFYSRSKFAVDATNYTNFHKLSSCRWMCVHLKVKLNYEETIRDTFCNYLNTILLTFDIPLSIHVIVSVTMLRRKTD